LWLFFFGNKAAKFFKGKIIKKAKTKEKSSQKKQTKLVNSHKNYLIKS